MGMISNPAPGVGTMVDASEITFPLDVTRAAAADDVITSKVTGDAFNRFVYNTDGKLEWGTGAAALAVSLFHTGVGNELKTNGALQSSERIAASQGGVNQTEMGSIGPGAESGIKFGATGDVSLYRSGADILKTDDSFHLQGVFRHSSTFEHVGGSAGFFGAAPTNKPTALTAADATAIDAAYGEVEQKVIENIRTRVNELDTKLKALGLIA